MYCVAKQRVLTADCFFEGVVGGGTFDGNPARHFRLVEHESGQLGIYLARSLPELGLFVLRRRLKNIRLFSLFLSSNYTRTILTINV